MLQRSPTQGRPTAARKPGRWLPVAVVALAALGLLLDGTFASAADYAKNRAGKARATEKEKSGLSAGAKLSHTQLAQVIDQKVDARLKDNGVAASGLCSDAEFIRRVYLDVIGVVPPADKVAEFLDSRDPDKRAKLIDELLASPRYGKFFGEIWTNALLPQDSNNRRLQSEPMLKWLAERLNKNQPWDKIVYDIVTADGPIDKNQAITFFVANPSPDKMTDQVTQLFLGVQLQCAQCHNHPFTDVKQDEYWGMAAFFMNTRVNGNPNQAAKKGITLTVSESGGARGKKAKLPESAKIVPAKFFGGAQPELSKKDPYRPVLASWMTAKDNRYFARAIANKLWHHFFGRGIVNPVDDMHDDNYATHPELLAALTEQVKANDFDLKYLIRAICTSQAYQRTSRPTGNNGDDQELFSHGLVRMLTPEQLYDSLDQVLGSGRDDRPAARKGKAAAAKRGNANGPREQFVAFFSTDNGFNPLEYQSGIPQALRVMNSRQLNTAGAVAQAMKAGKTPEQVIEHLYLSALARRPTTAETERLTQYVREQGTPRDAYGDIVWALINSSEFTLNH